MTPTAVKIPTVAIYARVSTSDQTCQSQLDELRDYVERRGWTLVAEYVDTGWSGAKKDRPQLTKLMRDAKQHRFDIVMCWKLDRFGRSVANFVDNLEQLDAWGIRFMCITQAVDTDRQSPSSRLLMCVLAAVAEFERSMIAERVKAGMNAAKRRGVQLGRKKVVFDRQKVAELHLRGKSVRAIAAHMNLNRGVVLKAIQAYSRESAA